MSLPSRTAILRRMHALSQYANDACAAPNGGGPPAIRRHIDIGITLLFRMVLQYMSLQLDIMADQVDARSWYCVFLAPAFVPSRRKVFRRRRIIYVQLPSLTKIAQTLRALSVYTGRMCDGSFDKDRIDTNIMFIMSLRYLAVQLDTIVKQLKAHGWHRRV